MNETHQQSSARTESDKVISASVVWTTVNTDDEVIRRITHELERNREYLVELAKANTKRLTGRETL